MVNSYRKKCLCCNKSKLNKIIDLGQHSFADRFIPKKKIKQVDPKYPLILDLCSHCKFIQSRAITDPKKRYSEIDYSYTSSNSQYSRNHWIDFAKNLNKKINVKGKKIYEIGSNDGFLIHCLKKMGAKVLGIDASEFMVKISKKRVRTINCIFNYDQSIKIKKKYGKADIIIANNVFNHSDNPKNFLQGIQNLLKKNSIFIFEQPYFASGLYSLKFDQIYHEHISYFTAKNIQSILNNCKLKIFSMEKNKYHGDSLRTIAVKRDFKLKKKANIKFIISENKKGIYKKKFYTEFNYKIKLKREKLLKKIDKFRENNFKIAGIGAGAKSNTFLTFSGLNNNKIKFLTDSSKFKQNKLTPLTRIPIKDDKAITKINKLACIILSWNISKMVIKKIKKINNKAIIIKT